MSEENKKARAELHRGQKSLPSGAWKRWYATMDERSCESCEKNNGKIYAAEIEPHPAPPLHPHCRCTIAILEAIIAGTASIDGDQGADWFLRYHGMLPRKYITAEQARAFGWISKKGNLAEVAPNLNIGGDIYTNKDGKLPDHPDRIWREADINYVTGFRGNARVLYSSDGLLFVTYDHYKTFMEIV